MSKTNPADTLAALADEIETAALAAPLVLGRAAIAISPALADDWISRLRALASLKGEAEPVAWVPVHPKNGPLWSMTTNDPSPERMPSYPLRPLIYGDTAPPPQQADSMVKLTLFGVSGNEVAYGIHEAVQRACDNMEQGVGGSAVALAEIRRLREPLAAPPAPQAVGEAVDPQQIGHPTNRYLYKAMLRKFGIPEQCNIADALKIVSTHPTPSPAPQGGGEADAVGLLREVCAQLHGVGCGPCVGSYAPMEDLHGRIAKFLGRKPDKNCRHCDGSGNADSGGECPCVTYRLVTPPAQQPGECAHVNDVLAEDGVRFCNVCGAPKEKGNAD